MPEAPEDAPETPRRRRRREEIYDHAIAIFDAKGYAAASIEEIAETVGVLKGSLYYYIDSKEDLLVRIFDRSDEEFGRLIEETWALDLPAVDRLRDFARRWCLWYLENIERARVYVNDWIHLTGARREHTAQMRREYGRRVQELIDAAVQEVGAEPRVDPELARLYVFSAVNGLPRWYRRDGTAAPEVVAEAYAELIVGTVLHAIGAP
ncbi:TetR/AcrR family transcriptional regulator [Baekduia soli]|uniref:TetR/AcrR family transcriptional regulator n=1 Tax=Baekduia soli TaxID=496014 RepID=UPI001651FC38|nr:TetR/AcrR family transcriptional regulator [Baekduia soli]